MTGHASNIDAENMIFDFTSLELPDGGSHECRMNAQGGFVMIPAEGSFVIAAKSEDLGLFCLFAEEIDDIIINARVTFNDGDNGGLCNTPTLKEQLDKTNDLIDAIVQIINGAPIPEPGNGSVSAFQAALKAALIGQELGDFSNIEDDTIKH